MKLFSYKLFIGLIILFFCCSTMKKGDDDGNLRNEAITIAINDFLDNCSLRETDSVFRVYIDIDNDDILGLSISGTYGIKICPSFKDTIGAETRIFPSHYIEKDNKLIYWRDSIHILTEEIVKVLVKYNQIDSSYIDDENAYPDYLLDESIKGADYYFCKNDLSIYKRVVTRIAMGWYDPPKLNCNKKRKKN